MRRSRIPNLFHGELEPIAVFEPDSFMGQNIGGWVSVGAGRAILLLAFVLSLAGCHKAVEKQPALTVQLELAPQPPRTGPSLVTLMVTDAEGKVVGGAHVSVEGNMTHAGMGPVTAVAKELEAGRYQAPFEFSMDGDWVVLVHVTQQNGLSVERQFEVKGVGGN